jgi:chemotaxis protein methyltransferase CheR
MDPHVIAPKQEEAEELESSSLLEAIYRVYHHDFRGYTGASIRRRLRSALVHFKCETMAALERRVLAEASTFTELLRFLTVQVTDMFRDPSYYRALREHVVPYLQTYASHKVWVAGCATGEEAYSLAILLSEEGLLDRTLIYATDIHPDSLRIAQSGAYDADRIARFSEGYRLAGGRGSLADHYAAVSGGVVLDHRLRKAIVFSDHSLATDSAFAEVQLVSCRNVLIYFARELQDRAVGVMRASLCRRGFLGLGLKETLRFTSHAAAFKDLLPDVRIYQRLT